MKNLQLLTLSKKKYTYNILDSIETEIDAFGGKYSDPAKSKWTITIDKSENSLEPFELK